MANPTKSSNIYVNVVRGGYSPTVVGPKVKPRGGSVLGGAAPQVSVGAGARSRGMGLDSEAFDIAEDLARAAGVSVDQWLSQTIINGGVSATTSPARKGARKTAGKFTKTPPETLEDYVIIEGKAGTTIRDVIKTTRLGPSSRATPRAVPKK